MDRWPIELKGQRASRWLCNLYKYLSSEATESGLVDFNATSIVTVQSVPFLILETILRRTVSVRVVKTRTLPSSLFHC